MIVVVSMVAIDLRDARSIIAAASIDEPRPMYALLVGISDYKDGRPQSIAGCVNNVDLLRSSLIEWGFPDDNRNILTLKNEQATYKGVTDAFRKHLTANASREKANGREAVVVYYFCGHGSQYPNAANDDEETDGLDETFVAWDSRAPGVFDILDDEIADLRYELSQHTSKTTLIFESCHSGTGSRNPSVKGADIMRTAADERSRKPYVRRFPQSKLPPDPTTYVEISAAHSALEALSESAALAAPDKPYGLMTKSLVKALRAANTSGSVPTYRELMRDIRQFIVSGPVRSDQSPQIEGDLDAPLFGIAGARRAFIEVIDTDSNARIATIKAGTIHGIAPGSQIAFYRKGSSGSGANGWIANGTVTSVGSFESTVNVGAERGSPFPIDRSSNAVIAAANPADPIFLDLNSPTALSDAVHKEILSEVRATLAKEGLFENGTFREASAETRSGPNVPALSIVRSKLSEVFGSQKTADHELLAPVGPEYRCSGDSLVTVERTARFPRADEVVYYVIEGEPGSPPLYGKTFRSGDPDIAAGVADVIRGRAYQQRLSRIEFRNSDLRKYADLKVEVFPTGSLVPFCRGGQLVHRRPAAQTVLTDVTARAEVKAGSHIKLTLRNRSGDVNRKETGDPYASGLPLHFALIEMTNDGQVRSLYGSTGADEPLEDGATITRTIKIDRPATSSKYAVFVSRQYVDFSFLELRGTKRDSGPALGELFSDGARSGQAVFSSPGDWGVLHYELKIRP